MNKKWRVVIITSMIILVLEIAGSLFFLFPYYRLQRVFNSIDKGQWTETLDYYNALNDSQKETALSYLDGYGAYLSERYANGEISYIQVAASFDAINSITETTEIFDKYTPAIDRNEYVKLIQKLFEANVAKNTELKYSTIAEIGDIQKRIPSDTREGILVEMLNKKLDQFVDGILSYDDMNIFVELVKGNSINKAYEYAITVQLYAQNIVSYRETYTEIEELISRQKYIEAIELIDNTNVYDFDEEYFAMYQAARTDAYETGKAYYTELLQSYISSDDLDNSIALMASLEAVYGDDLDISSAKDALMDDWQVACIERVENWEDYLKSKLMQSDTGKYILDNEYDNLRPDSIELYDINEDGYPELLMFNSGRLEDDYLGTFVFGYDGNEYVYMNYVNIITFGISDNILAFPICFGREPGEEVCIYNYDGQSLTAGKSAQKFGDTCYVDGAEVNSLDYLSAQTEIMLNQDAKRVQNSGYVSMSEYKKYIIGYENEFTPQETTDNGENNDDNTDVDTDEQ